MKKIKTKITLFPWMVLFLLSKLKALRFPFDFMSEVATEIKGRRTSSYTDQRRRSIGASPDEIQ